MRTLTAKAHRHEPHRRMDGRVLVVPAEGKAVFRRNVDDAIRRGDKHRDISLGCAYRICATAHG